MTKHLGRRRFLRGAGFAVALPWLESLAARGARAQTRKRFIVWYQPDGDMDKKPYWFPSGGETDFQYGEASSMLAPIKQDTLLLHGVHHGMMTGDAHGSWMKTLQTGGGKDSIDQLVASSWAAPTPFRSLEFGVGTDKGPMVGGQLSFKDGFPMLSEANPNKMFARLFKDAAAAPATPGLPDAQAEQQVKLLQDKKRSVLDGVLEELAEVRSQVSGDDRARLDSHAGAIRDFEKSLAALHQVQAQAPASCARPAVDLGGGLDAQTNWNGGVDSNPIPNYDKVAAVQQQMAVLALRCDLTRVLTIMYSRSNSGQTFPFLDIVNKDKGSHFFAHSWRGSRSLETDFVKIKRWRAGMFVSLVSALKAIPEGTGSMLDSTVLLWTCEMGLGDAHAGNNIPFVLAGGGGSAFKGGRYLDFGVVGQPHTKLYLALLQAMGVPARAFGNASEALPRVLG